MSAGGEDRLLSVLNRRRVGGDDDGTEDVWKSNVSMWFCVDCELVSRVDPLYIVYLCLGSGLVWRREIMPVTLPFDTQYEGDKDETIHR